MVQQARRGPLAHSLTPSLTRSLSTPPPSSSLHGQRSESSFDLDTAITPTHTHTHTHTPSGGGGGAFAGFVSDSWSIGDAPNGGYLMASAISAARECVPFRDPLSITAYYLSKAEEREAMDITVEVLGVAKSSATVQVSLSQRGSLRSRYLGTFGSLKSFRGLTHQAMQAPELPPPRKCIDANAVLRGVMGDKLKIAQQVDFLVAKNSPFAQSVLQGHQGDTAVLECWVAFRDGRAPCLRSLAFFCDALPPPVLIVTPSNWVPTLEYTVHFWDRPVASTAAADQEYPPDAASSTSVQAFDNKLWLRCRMVTRHVHNSLLFTDAEIWGATGDNLLATSRQLARVLAPRGSSQSIGQPHSPSE